MDAENNIWLPIDAAPSSHILKPETKSQQFPFLPENEYFCMQLAEAVGLPVAPTRLLQLPESVLVIDRYDRAQANNKITRIHQIDLCQVLNLPPEAKYEHSELGAHGARLRDLFSATQLLSNPALGRAQLLDWVIFNYISGNTDAHAKNVSFLVDAGSFNVAPAYDLLCGDVYGAKHFAQEIGDNDEIGLITAADWLKFAKQSDLPASLLQMQLSTIATSVLAELEEVSILVPAKKPATNLIQEIVKSTRQRAQWALAAATDISKLSRP
jgi:serine/threonine-protein kinase HipA